MNTRLQVEHPVTELVTGLDLVRLQIEIAAGGRLPFTQETDCAARRGHRMPYLCRGSANNFFPSPGRITQLAEPSGPGVRLDSGIYPGWTVPSITTRCWPSSSPGPVRASRRLIACRRALGEYHIGGIQSNISLFQTILKDSAFRAGELDTGYLDRLLQRDPEPAEPPSVLAAIAALVALGAESKV